VQKKVSIPKPTSLLSMTPFLIVHRTDEAERSLGVLDVSLGDGGSGGMCSWTSLLSVSLLLGDI
jgi:hypothetical protein